MSNVTSSRMGARRSRRSADLDSSKRESTLQKGEVRSAHPGEDISDVYRRVAPAENGDTDSGTITTAGKPSLKGSEERAGARASSKKRQARDDEHNISGDRGMVVVGEKASASTRGEPTAGHKPAKIEVNWSFLRKKNDEYVFCATLLQEIVLMQNQRGIARLRTLSTECSVE